MRWKRPPRPGAGEFRYETRFLWFPMTIDGETRWLEWATWKKRAIYPYGNRDHHSSWYWRKEHWKLASPAEMEERRERNEAPM